MNSNMLDVIVRIHDPRRLDELKRCVFSIACQSYRPITINICCQRFSGADLEAVSAQVATVLVGNHDIALKFHNFGAVYPADARSALLNMGVKAAQGRHLAFLDYDDVIFPNAYAQLIEDLNASGAAISFGRINVKHVMVQDDYQIVLRRERPFKGENVVHLFKGNFCPIHSFVIDRGKVDPADIYFDQSLTRNEDYDFLLRFCSSYVASFNMRETVMGDYYCKSDGSNTILVQASFNEENVAAWKLAEDLVELRREILYVSPAVQRALGIAEIDPKLTIKRLIATEA